MIPVVVNSVMSIGAPGSFQFRSRRIMAALSFSVVIGQPVVRVINSARSFVCWGLYVYDVTA